MQQAEQNAEHLGLANGRVPPTWSLEKDKAYPLRTYVQDLEVWAAATDLLEARMAPAAVLRLTGAARTVMREVPTALLTLGQDFVDAAGNQAHRTGLEVLVRILQARYGALPQEQQIFAVSELMTFHRMHGETTDEMLARWDIIMFRAVENGGVVNFNPPVRAWIILTHLRIPRGIWPTLLAPTMGLLPTTEAEYTQMIAYVRRNSHLHENQGDRSKTLQHPYFVDQSSASQHVFTTWDEDSTYWDQSVDYSSSGYDNTYASDFHDDTHSWHTFSTGNSEPIEPIDWTDVDAIPPADLNEFLFHQYLFAKRRFRAVGFKRRRFVGRPMGKGGKGKRRGRKGKGKGGHGKHEVSNSGFWTGEQQWVEPDQESEVESDRIFFQGGKGGKSSGGGNPIGKDGTKMRCGICHSEDHFWRACPSKGKGKGKGKQGSASSHGKSSSSKPSFYSSPPEDFQNFHSHQSYSPNPAEQAYSKAPPATHASMFMLNDAAPVVRTPHTRISFMDGSPDVEIQSARNSEVANSWFTPAESAVVQNFSTEHAIVPAQASRHDLFYAWWHSSDADIADDEELQVSYHSKVRLQFGESLLIDTGAIKPLAGDEWVKRAAAAAQSAGRGTSFVPLDRPLSVEGVGQGSSSCSHRAVIPIAMEDGVTGTYSPAVVPNSQIPALVGFDTLERRRVLLDCFQGKYYEIGEGGYDIQLSPGSRLLHLHKAQTGHPMIPATQWDKVKPGTAQTYTNM